MARQLSANALRAALAREADEVFLVCLKIEHPSISTIRLVNNTDPVVRSSDGTYQPFAFAITLPTESEDQIPSVTITIDSVDRSIIEAIRTISGRPSVTFMVVLASSPDTIEVGPFQFALTSSTYNSLTVSGQLSYEEDVLNQAVPMLTYTPVNSPGLFKG